MGCAVKTDVDRRKESLSLRNWPLPCGWHRGGKHHVCDFFAQPDPQEEVPAGITDESLYLAIGKTHSNR